MSLGCLESRMRRPGMPAWALKQVTGARETEGSRRPVCVHLDNANRHHGKASVPPTGHKEMAPLVERNWLQVPEECWLVSRTWT